MAGDTERGSTERRWRWSAGLAAAASEGDYVVGRGRRVLPLRRLDRRSRHLVEASHGLRLVWTFGATPSAPRVYARLVLRELCASAHCWCDHRQVKLRGAACSSRAGAP